ncbi:MAG: hypothetical protein R6U20_08570 [Longimonas sp.]|uniref:hypothetical protein n=1 Tax=Longimonas sp. TaxID=2039626 RepID=UPI0039759B23
MTELLEFLGTYWWILIVLIVFVYSAFEEWLEFKTEQRKIGASTEETEEKLEALRTEWEAERKRLNRRIQHLETIVTSEAWDRAHSDDALQEPLLDDMEPEDRSSHEEKAEQLAQRLRNR